MSTVVGFKLTSSIITFTASLLSAIGSGLILLCYLALPLKKHFRHVLIINLAVADFINSVNNSASGAQILMHRKNLSHGPGCVLNGFLGQISVQATDTAIFAIAVVTVFTIAGTSHSRLISGEWEWPQIVGATFSIWLLPVLTSFIALGKGWYAPVSGNWCWLVNNPVYLRYVLTHGWRYLFMVLEVVLYTYLHFYLRRHFRKLAVPLVSNIPSSGETHTTHESAATAGTHGTGLSGGTAFGGSNRTQSPVLEPITFTRNPDELDTRLSHSDELHSSVTSPSSGDGRRYRRRRGNSIYVDPTPEEEDLPNVPSPLEEEEPQTPISDQPHQHRHSQQLEPPSPLNETNDALSISTHAHSGKRLSSYVVEVEKSGLVDAPPVYAISTHPVDAVHTHPPSKHPHGPTFSIKRLIRRASQKQAETQALQQNPRQRAIQRILLLNAYPLLYIILWIPGLANRVIEATGHTSRVTQILQASTQLVGLANAVTYGWNERIWKQLKEMWARRRRRSMS